MINSRQVHIIKLPFILKGSIIPIIAPQIVFITLFSLFVALSQKFYSAILPQYALIFLPLAYRFLVHRTVYLFCFILPFGLVNSLGLMTPILSSIIAYAFLGLDSLSTELEQPFTTSLADITFSIEQNLLENLDELNQT